MARSPQNPMFPLSRSTKQFLAHWDEGKDPLEFLNPGEVTAAELWVSMRMDPGSPKNWASGYPDKRAFATKFREHFGFELSSAMRQGLMLNPAWRAYTKSLMSQTRDAILKRLEATGFEALQDYLKSREMAKEAGDYKELRVGAADHLDRIGATQKPEITKQSVVVVLQSRNFNERSLTKELPAVEAAEIVVESE